MSNGTGTSVNEVYDTFKDAGRSAILIVIIGIKFSLITISSLLSATLVYVIMANKSLKGPFHKLILYNGLTNVMNMFNPMITFVVVASGTNFIPLLQCFCYQAISLFFAYCQQISFLFIGIDRLMATLFPIWHKQHRNPFVYLSVLILASLVYPSLTIYYSADYVLQQPQKLVMCSGPDCSPSTTFYWTWAINGCSLLCYLLLGIGLKLWRLDEHSPVEFTRRIFKSLALMLLLELFGWFAYSCLRLALSTWGLFQLSQMQLWYIFQMPASWFLIIILGLNPVVLFASSTDYRNAYLREFKWLSRLLGLTTTTTPMGGNNNGNANRSNAVGTSGSRPTGPWITS